uniref:Surface glycoprotein n=1 Tax=Caenorhabditis tropicalis TaxID=1561998 RepID=A0A1I7TVE9_9PELO
MPTVMTKEINVESLSRIGFDMTLGMDVTKNMDFTLYCGGNQSHYNIKGWKNPTKKYGTVKLVSPIGEFGYNGYSYYDTPRYAVFTEKGPHSATSCRKIGSHYMCVSPTNNCTMKNYKECPLKYNQTPQGVFSMDLGDATVISTIHHMFTAKVTYTALVAMVAAVE